MDEAQVKDLATKMASELQKDIDRQIKQIEEQFKNDGTVSADAKKGVEDLQTAVKRIEDEFGKKFSDLTVAFNRNNIPTPGTEQQKGYYDLIKGGLEEKAKNGGLVNGIKSQVQFELKDGQGAMHLKAVGDMTNTNLSGGYALRETRPQIISSPYRKTRVRSLLNVGTINSPIMEYMKNTGGEGGVGFQTEGGLKAQVDFDFTMVTETIKTIAVFAVVSKQMLADIPRLANFLSNQMTNKWFDFEDNQIINGDNTGNNFNGLLNQASAYTPTNGTENTYFEYLVDAIAQLENTNFEATGILINPLDFVSLLTYKTTTGEFDHPGLVYGADNILRLYGTAIVKNNAIAKNAGLVGDFTQAELLVHDGLSFDMSYDDSDNFRRNKVTLRLEAREGFAVYQPTAFRKLDFTTLSGL